MQQWLEQRLAQWAVLGTGDLHYQQVLTDLASRHGDQLAVRMAFSDPLAHRIEAGADIFLMPSRYEPCGLNQLYSLRYGAAPVVRATGGLADTITDATAETLQLGTANGFAFEAYDPPALEEALHRARTTFLDRPDDLRQIVDTGMRQDWSWDRSARQYLELYERTCRMRNGSPLRE
jgi:starch synthase